MSITVVIASNREFCMQKWLAEWEADLSEVRVIVVEDGPERSFNLDGFSYQHLEHYSWLEIDQDLGEDSWIIPRRTSAIKSYGFLLAGNTHEDTFDPASIIWTLDDDCYPEDYLIGGPPLGTPMKGNYLRHLEAVMNGWHDNGTWWNTIEGTGFWPRGFPYGIRRRTAVNHGLWSGVPDLDGQTALEYPELRLNHWPRTERVPEGKMFPMCGMNLAFRREMLPVMYFMLQGHMRVIPNAAAPDGLEKLRFDRFDDIWAGLMVKKACDVLHLPVTSGFPSIVHTKESDPHERVVKEAPGIAAHEDFWQHIAVLDLSDCESFDEVYYELAEAVYEYGRYREKYWQDLARAMHTWRRLTR